MDEWLEVLRYDPIGCLKSTDNKAIEFFCMRDLLGDPGGARVEDLWSLPGAQRLTRKQQEDGSWRYPNPRAERSPVQNYSLLETFRNLGILVEKYGMNKDHPTVQRAAEYLFSCQTGEGDFRGILGNQYMPYYIGAIMELLIKAGYGDHPGIERGFRWLLSVRQEDGGWNIPMKTAGLTYSEVFESPPVPTDRTKPFSHLITGMVLRAFAAHPRYRRTREALHAAGLLKGRFFKRDSIPDRGDPSYWTKFSYPYWFTDMLTSLDSLSLMGFPPDDGDIKKGLDWFVKSQKENGSWELAMLRGGGDKNLKYWLALAICRVFKRFFG